MSSTGPKRDPSVDWARGVAALAMIEGHATHAWVSEAGKQSFGYAVTRFVATTPLPAFLLLSGMAVRLRLGAASDRAQAVDAVRNGLVRRGLWVVFWGYLTSALYAAMDGHQGLRTFLRADVLHVIGLSIAALGLFCIGGADARVDLGRSRRRALVLMLGVTLSSPLIYRLLPAPSGALRYVVAPFVRVPGVTIFPLLPMLAWSAGGFLAADLLARIPKRRDVVYGTAALSALALAILCEYATRALLAPGERLDDMHPLGILNMVGYAARGLTLIAVAPLLVSRLPRAAQSVVSRFGRASLIAYVFHIPFCYGVLGASLKRRLSLFECVVPVALLMLASYAAIVVIQRLRPMLAAGLSLRAARGSSSVASSAQEGALRSVRDHDPPWAARSTHFEAAADAGPPESVAE